ncbi:flagellar motor protein MotB [Halopseudomonas maritima]|uniref:flagellar motor protein MotB n=1 Tax=Halopseudomonas maritima TaxID=2918528 RepID=UPI001EEBB7E4|nr:flagellar motor protein MotB [Halopseudomonas maritima]UJJ30846.1 flagellar motor protein MotB [Halopseudomonas maritima]
MDNNQPIIVKRITRKDHGHHGGSWKIAFADFAVAMMAFFLVMWLITVATPEQLRSISGYFNDPIGFNEGGSPWAIDLGGSPEVAPQATLNQTPQETGQQEVSEDTARELADQAERRDMEMLLQELQNQIDSEPVLQRFKDQILIEITQDGLRIQIVDAENRPMFASGSAQLQPYFEEILLSLSDTIAKVKKKISVSGHTDAQPYVGRRGYGNWELSSDRANAARRTLLAAGYPEEQVARVVGYADSALFNREDPLSPINRRIDIVVLNRHAEEQIMEGADADAPALAPLELGADAEASAVDQPAQTSELPAPSALPQEEPSESAAPQAPAAEGEQRRLNLFDNAEPLRRLNQ